MEETIIACATAMGRAGIAVIRLSGAQSFELGRTLCREALPRPRRLERRTIYGEGGVLDHAMMVIFPAPHSYNGEDILEIHCHGSLAIVTSLIETCTRHHGVRLARPGEFTRRAVLAGKQDLVQAESLLDLIDAETQAQRELALCNTVGLEPWRRRLADHLASLEATLEFGESENLDPTDHHGGLGQLHKEIRCVLEQRTGEAIRNGIRVVLYGAPNVGKSSLFNRIVSREAALVSSQPGTTRDRIETALEIGGYKVLLSDTAGLHESTHHLERAGMERTQEAMADADILLHVTTGSRYHQGNSSGKAHLETSDKPSLVLINKQDLAAERISVPLEQNAIAISARSGSGFEELHARLTQLLREHFRIPRESIAITRHRHRTMLSEAAKDVKAALEEPELELQAERLRHAYRTLDEAGEQGGIENVLDRLFSQFCIGK